LALATSFSCYKGALQTNGAIMAKVKKVVRREYSKADVKELRAHSKAKTPVARIARLTRRTAGSLRQKARKLGIPLGHRR
jgi:hypothetical protein